MRLVDLLPTLIELSGLRRPDGLAGSSLLELLAGGEDPSADRGERPALLETSRFDTSQVGLRWRDHKLISDLVTGEDRLYDLRRDSTELADLAGGDSTAESTAILEGMRRRLRTATLEAVTDRWKVDWRPGSAAGRLRAELRTNGRFVAAVDASGTAVEIADDGRLIELDLGAGEGLELVVLPIDAEISLAAVRTDLGVPVPIVLGGAEPAHGLELLTFTATSLQPLADREPHPLPALFVQLEQEHLVAASVALDDEKPAGGSKPWAISSTEPPQAYRPRLTGRRRAPQVPGRAAKRPAQSVPQLAQRPSSVRFQSESTYQSRPISSSPQAWQYVLPPAASWTLPV